MDARERIHFPWMLVILAVVGAAHAQDNWPQWRGPAQNGISTATGLPATWSEAEHIVWKTPLPSWSGGSPVIWGDQVFVTSPSSAPAQNGDDQQRRRDEDRDPGGSELLLICISKQHGDILWERELDDGNKLSRKQNDSSPSPVTDGRHVWVLTGTGAVAAFDMKGEQIWEKNLQEAYGPFGQMFGFASSPLLYDGKLIIQVLHGYNTDAPSYLVAFDALTGDERWREERTTDAVSESPDAYTTPTVLRHEGTAQIVVSGGDYVTGHDPETGREIWRAGGLNPKELPNYRVIASPVVAEEIIYVPSRKKPLLALRAGGTGDVTTSHLVWKWDKRGGPDVPSPVCDGKYFYMVDDRGSATCLDAKTGQVVWGPERTARGTVSASPLLADGKLYITNEDAVTTVLAAGPKYKLLATNELEGGGGYTLSSLAVSGPRIFMRTARYLYCIGHKTD
ncbi:MAG: PQQ-binding-like beta-propeller repeat protein [Nitrospiraceae bacterium]|nr:PQQ-binding-like beta-propeller repeat protein [Nitrospiraceae bacterium]